MDFGSIRDFFFLLLQEYHLMCKNRLFYKNKNKYRIEIQTIKRFM